MYIGGGGCNKYCVVYNVSDRRNESETTSSEVSIIINTHTRCIKSMQNLLKCFWFRCCLGTHAHGKSWVEVVVVSQAKGRTCGNTIRTIIGRNPSRRGCHQSTWDEATSHGSAKDHKESSRRDLHSFVDVWFIILQTKISFEKNYDFRLWWDLLICDV